MEVYIITVGFFLILYSLPFAGNVREPVQIPWRYFVRTVNVPTFTF